MPAPLYRAVEAGMIRLTGALQRLRLAVQSRNRRPTEV
jgi:hypothetical protein